MGGRNLTRRRLPRAQREANLQRIVLVTSAVVGGVVAVLVILALVNELIIVPNRVFATVNGTEILAVDYQDRYRYELGGQGGQLPQGQISSNPEIEFGRRILDSMISSIILEEAAEEAGITVTEEEIREEIELAFGYDAGEPEPTGTPTATPIGAEREPTATPTLVLTAPPAHKPPPHPAKTPTATVGITPPEPGT
ncbi:MAG: SurA N-terminal domain-containing protein, partial [Anaerolineae bacterium]